MIGDFVNLIGSIGVCVDILELTSRQRLAGDAYLLASGEHFRIFKQTTKMSTNHTHFAPQLMIDNGIKDISFYTHAFNAKEHFILRNDDDSIHVAEFSIDDAIFHIHEVSQPNYFIPQKHNGTTAIIGLFVPDVDAVMDSALQAGARLISKAKDYEYGYRQGLIEDPFGHRWLIQKKNHGQ